MQKEERRVRQNSLREGLVLEKSARDRERDTAEMAHETVML